MVELLIGAVGVGTAIVREVLAGRERRRSRPVVVVHEDRGRHFRDGGGIAVRVWLTNESSVSAFNVRFGIELHGVRIPYRYGSDVKPARINVLRPGDRWPTSGAIELRLPDELAFAEGGDPDPSRRYRARYTSAGDDRWATINPYARDENFVIVRLTRFAPWLHARRSEHALARARDREQQTISELLERSSRGENP